MPRLSDQVLDEAHAFALQAIAARDAKAALASRVLPPLTAGCASPSRSPQNVDCTPGLPDCTWSPDATASNVPLQYDSTRMRLSDACFADACAGAAYLSAAVPPLSPTARVTPCVTHLAAATTSLHLVSACAEADGAERSVSPSVASCRAGDAPQPDSGRSTAGMSSCSSDEVPCSASPPRECASSALAAAPQGGAPAALQASGGGNVSADASSVISTPPAATRAPLIPTAPDSPQVLTVNSEADWLPDAMAALRALDAESGTMFMDVGARRRRSGGSAADPSASCTAATSAHSCAPTHPELGVFIAHTDAPHVTSAPPVVVSVDGERYTMPANFGVVEPNVYRCAFPAPDAYPFLTHLRLKTIINLLPREPQVYLDFAQRNGIRYLHAAVKGNKATCEDMDREKVRVALGTMMDPANYPLIIHCRSGKHRTGAVIGCLRILQRWSLERACEEYVHFCHHKQRTVDKQYIERFQPRTLAEFAHPVGGLPAWLPVDCADQESALQAAINRGELDPADAERGIQVSMCSDERDEVMADGGVGVGGGFPDTATFLTSPDASRSLASTWCTTTANSSIRAASAFEPLGTTASVPSASTPAAVTPARTQPSATVPHEPTRMPSSRRLPDSFVAAARSSVAAEVASMHARSALAQTSATVLQPAPFPSMHTLVA